MNPYFTGSPIPDMSDTIFKAAEYGQRNQQLALNKDQFYAENPRMKPFGNAELLKFMSKAKMAGIPVEEIDFVKNDLAKMAQNPDMNRGDIADAMEQKWPEIHASVSDNIRNKVLKLSDQAAKLDPTDPKYNEIAGQIEKLGNLQSGLDNVKSPTDIFFRDISDYRNSKKGSIGELEKVVGEDGQPILVPRSQAVGQRPYLKEDSKPLVIPEGGVLMGPDGKPVYKNPKTFKAGEPGNPNEKVKDKAVRRIEEHIQKYYTLPNQQLEKKLEYKISDEERRRIEEQIAYNNEQMMIAINTKNQVLNDELDPTKIIWGGSGKTQTKSNRFKVEVIK